MTRLALTAVLCLPFWAADPNLAKTLKGIEQRYNRAKTLQVEFQETYSAGGRARKLESGLLSLRKPGRMRWDYNDPAGKLFVSDGKSVFYYTPAGNRVEKMKLRETEDMRAPLAFLLGKLDFSRDFQEYQSRMDGQDLAITAKPKSDRLPYSGVVFLVTPDFRIRKLDVAGHDGSLITFNFANERLNPPIQDQMFRFRMPAGATLIDTSEGEGR